MEVRHESPATTRLCSKYPNMAQSHEVVVDALPYIDQGYDEPGVREAVSVVERIIKFYVLRLMGWMHVSGTGYGGGGDSAVSSYEKLLGASTSVKFNGL